MMRGDARTGLPKARAGVKRVSLHYAKRLRMILAGEQGLEPCRTVLETVMLH